MISSDENIQFYSLNDERTCFSRFIPLIYIDYRLRFDNTILEKYIILYSRRAYECSTSEVVQLIAGVVFDCLLTPYVASLNEDEHVIRLF